VTVFYIPAVCIFTVVIELGYVAVK
jgi:hypothetical protein